MYNFLEIHKLTKFYEDKAPYQTGKMKTVASANISYGKRKLYSQKKMETY
jgi:hypothetical protein